MHTDLGSRPNHHDKYSGFEVWPQNGLLIVIIVIARFVVSVSLKIGKKTSSYRTSWVVSWWSNKLLTAIPRPNLNVRFICTYNGLFVLASLSLSLTVFVNGKVVSSGVTIAWY